MTISIAPQYTQRPSQWTTFKNLSVSKRFLIQYDDDGEAYTIWGYDGPEAHVCTIWKGEVPWGVVSGGYTQEQNDADKSDFEANYKDDANQCLEPRQADGSPFTSPCIFMSGLYLNYTGAGDSADTRGAGDAMIASRDTSGEATVTWGFLDPVFVAGGITSHSGAEYGDWASLEIYAPATVVTPNDENTGNCTVVDGVIVPADGDGDYDVDLDEAVPVPAIQLDGSYNGYWDYSYSLVGKGTITAGSPGTAHWHLIAADVTLVRYANRVLLLGADTVNFSSPVIEPKVMLPQWKGKMILHNENGHSGLKFAFSMMIGRAVTT